MSSDFPDRRGVLGGLVVSPLGLSRALGRERLWPGGARAAVSLTYDDGLNSQLDTVVPELEARGLKASFFLVRDNVDARIADWVKVAQLGHEMGNHTVSHPCALAGYDEAVFADQQVLPMEAYLDGHFGAKRPRIFAYPCGYLGLGRGEARRRFGRYRMAVQDTIRAARTVAGAPNDPMTAWANRLGLCAFEPTYDEDSVGPAVRYLNAALSQGAWAILVFHQVLPKRLGEGDTSISTHARILDLVQDQRFWCAPMGEVFEHLARHTETQG